MFPSRRNGSGGSCPSRAYAVGDIHGRLDLLDEILGKIEEDSSARGHARVTIVFLGDLIDRGPQSAQVVERLRRYHPAFAQTVFLMGNHEEVFLRVLGGDLTILPDWLRFGGAECLQSYGIDPADLQLRKPADVLRLLRQAIPKEHVKFLSGFVDTASFGQYLFVHAGIRPGVPLSQQIPEDLHWIRQPFLEHEEDHGHIVVHGHTISAAVDVRPNRIGLDTGAYRSGTLSALGAEGDERWFIQTGTGAGRGERGVRVAKYQHANKGLFPTESPLTSSVLTTALRSLLGLLLAAALAACASTRGGPIPYDDAGKFRAPDAPTVATLESGYRISPMVV